MNPGPDISARSMRVGSNSSLRESSIASATALGLPNLCACGRISDWKWNVQGEGGGVSGDVHVQGGVYWGVLSTHIIVLLK